MLLIFLGAPGSGKGTVSQEMVDKFHYKHISTGDIFRKIIVDGTDLGKKVKKLIEDGNLVEDITTWEVAKEALKLYDLNKDLVILDGYPRNINQAKLLDEWMAERSFTVVRSIYYDVPQNEILRRLTGRLMCRDCGRSFHKTTKVPKVSGICDVCGGILYQREDDKKERVQIRLEIYKKVTEPLIKYFNSKGNMIVIDGRLNDAAKKTVEEVEKTL